MTSTRRLVPQVGRSVQAYSSSPSGFPPLTLSGSLGSGSGGKQQRQEVVYLYSGLEVRAVSILIQ